MEESVLKLRGLMNMYSTDVSWLLVPVALPLILLWLRIWCSDGVPLFGYRRRSYLVLCGFLGALSWGSLASFVDNKFAATTMILLSSLSVAFADVVSFITNCFCSMLWLLVLWYHYLLLLSLESLLIFLKGFFPLFQALHWYHLHDSAKEQVFV